MCYHFKIYPEKYVYYVKFVVTNISFRLDSFNYIWNDFISLQKYLIILRITNTRLKFWE